jgi:hypothetical protein
MLSFNISLSNPWVKTNFRHIFNRSWLLSKYKAIEIEVVRDPKIILNFNIYYTTKCNHAGLGIDIGFLSFDGSVRFYDTRHWNYKTNSWQM